jgi:hypothetical protein
LHNRLSNDIYGPDITSIKAIKGVRYLILNPGLCVVDALCATGLAVVAGNEGIDAYVHATSGSLAGVQRSSELAV